MVVVDYIAAVVRYTICKLSRFAISTKSVTTFDFIEFCSIRLDYSERKTKSNSTCTLETCNAADTNVCLCLGCGFRNTQFPILWNSHT